MKKLSFLQKVIYGLPEGCAQLLMCGVGIYAMFFFTDIAMIDAAVVGTIFLAARAISFITDPAVGTFVDTRRPLKRGKFIPYMIFGCVIMGVTSVLIFINPDINMGLKIVYITVTYFLYNIAYSFFDVPYGSILTTLSSDYSEVSSTGSIRSFIGAIGIAFGAYCATGLQKIFGNMTGAINMYTMTSLVLGAVLIVSGFLLMRFVPERVAPVQKTVCEKSRIIDTFRVALTNKPLVIVVLVNFLSNLAWLMRNSIAIYFFQYSVGKESLLPLYMAIAGLSQLPIIAMLPKLTAKFGNRSVMVTATLISMIGFGALSFGPLNHASFVLAASAVSGIGWSTFYGLMFGMTANTVEYGEWKNGVRAAGVSSSLPLLAFKLTMGLSAFIVGLLLKAGGYIPGMVQSAAAIHAINAGFIYIPAVLAVLWLIVISFYDLNKKYPTIIKELEERRSAQ